jgi:hypothetical protein
MIDKKEEKNTESMIDKIDKLKKDVPKKDIPLGIQQKL